MMRKHALAVGATTFAAALFLSGCGTDGGSLGSFDQEFDLDGVYNDSASKQAVSSEEGVESGLLAAWVPAGGTNVQLQQRSTGQERLFTMDYEGDLPETCTAIHVPGEPSALELESAYASDERTKDMDPAEIVEFRTLEADWWPEGAEEKTTDLCGRWWVHQEDGKLYAFAPDTEGVANKVMEERAQ